MAVAWPPDSWDDFGYLLPRNVQTRIYVYSTCGNFYNVFTTVENRITETAPNSHIFIFVLNVCTRSIIRRQQKMNESDVIEKCFWEE